MPNLDPKTLAEGRRLLEDWRAKICSGATAYDLLRAQDAWYLWLHKHGASLVIAEQGAKAEACLRDIVEISEDAESADIVREIAARHGLDLGETPDAR